MKINMAPVFNILLSMLFVVTYQVSAAKIVEDKGGTEFRKILIDGKVNVEVINYMRNLYVAESFCDIDRWDQFSICLDKITSLERRYGRLLEFHNKDEVINLRARHKHLYLVQREMNKVKSFLKPSIAESKYSYEELGKRLKLLPLEFLIAGRENTAIPISRFDELYRSLPRFELILNDLNAGKYSRVLASNSKVNGFDVAEILNLLSNYELYYKNALFIGVNDYLEEKFRNEQERISHLYREKYTTDITINHFRRDWDKYYNQLYETSNYAYLLSGHTYPSLTHFNSLPKLFEDILLHVAVSNNWKWYLYKCLDDAMVEPAKLAAKNKGYKYVFSGCEKDNQEESSFFEISDNYKPADEVISHGYLVVKSGNEPYCRKYYTKVIRQEYQAKKMSIAPLGVFTPVVCPY